MKDNEYIFEGTFKTCIKASSHLEAFDILYKNSLIIENMDITCVTVKEDKNKKMVHDDNLDLSFPDKMRDATIEEQKGINVYVNSISHNTEINFFNYI